MSIGTILTSVAVALAGLSADTQSAYGPSDPDIVEPDVQMPTEAFIIDPSTLREMLNPCSRQAPYPATAAFRPTAAEIVRAEAALPMALDSASPRKYAAFRAAPHRWFRQYIGIIRGEQRTIYGNFFPRDITPPHLDVALYASRHPVDVCDGGSAFFGVEFDLSSGRYFHIAFNDPI